MTAKNTIKYILLPTALVVLIATVVFSINNRKNVVETSGAISPSFDISESEITTFETTSEPETTQELESTTLAPTTTKPTTTKPKTTAATTTTTTKAPVTQPAVYHDNIKGVWISYLEMISYKNYSESQFTTKMSSCLDNIKSKGLNTVIVHVRSHGDAIYPSNYYPWSKYITTSINSGLSYDPLQIIITLAHSKGLSVHAWVNPYRTMTDTEFADISNNYTTKQWFNSTNRADYMIKVSSDSRWWLKPGNPQVRELIINGVGEIVSKYNVDAIHIDDYFYGTNPSEYGDTQSQAKQNNTLLISGIYNKIKSINPKVLFGISPAGVFYTSASLPNSDNSYLSTDLNLWCNNSGYIDYVMPQIYWERGHSTQDFSRVLGQWRGFVKCNSVALYTGLAPYKLSDDEILAQVSEINSTGNSSGFCLFRYNYISTLNF
ncbi:MAG: hypothetical protein EOM05_05360 [Clostridia bacterium]|nr:hypothetical protein [Clostridia bacterium]